MKNKSKAFFIGGLFVLLIFNCVKPVTPTKIRVLTTIYPLAMIAQEVGGDSVSVSTIIPPGSSPHTFEPTPELATQISSAQLLIMNGAKLENWLTPALKAFSEDKKKRILIASDGEHLIPISGTNEPNPHIWLSPRRMKRLAERIAAELSAIAPQDSAYFFSRAGTTIARLDTLDKTLALLFAPHTGKSFVSVEPAWSYLASDYGFNEIGFLSPEPSRQVKPTELKELTKKIKEHRVRVFLSQKGLDQKIIAPVVKELGLKLIITDPLGSPSDTLVNTYEKLILYNARLIAGGL